MQAWVYAMSRHVRKRELDVFKNLQWETDSLHSSERSPIALATGSERKCIAQLKSLRTSLHSWFGQISIFRLSSNAKPHSFITQTSQWS